MGSSERQRELRRRRKRRKAVIAIKERAKKASSTEKEVLANKLRQMTPGAKELIDAMGLNK